MPNPTPPTPIYTADNCTFTGPLRWGLTVFWRTPIADSAWLNDLRQALRSRRHSPLEPSSQGWPHQPVRAEHAGGHCADIHRQSREGPTAIPRPQARPKAFQREHNRGRLPIEKVCAIAGGILPDHVHLALGCPLEMPPAEVVLAFLNNLAYAHGMKAVYQFGAYAGTFGEYHQGAVKSDGDWTGDEEGMIGDEGEFEP